MLEAVREANPLVVKSRAAQEVPRAKDSSSPEAIRRGRLPVRSAFSRWASDASRVLSRQQDPALPCNAAGSLVQNLRGDWRPESPLRLGRESPVRPSFSRLSHPGLGQEPLFFNLGLNVRSEFRTPS